MLAACWLQVAAFARIASARACVRTLYFTRPPQAPRPCVLIFIRMACEFVCYPRRRSPPQSLFLVACWLCSLFAASVDRVGPPYVETVARTG